jgi:hypothetical protein
MKLSSVRSERNGKLHPFGRPDQYPSGNPEVTRIIIKRVRRRNRVKIPENRPYPTLREISRDQRS